MPTGKSAREPLVEADEPRARLVRAASTLFAQRGFEGASTRDIAGRAGVNQGLIRYHFGSKEALFREVIDRGLNRIASELSQAPPAPEARAGALLAALARHPEPVQAIVHALLDPGPRRDWLMRERLFALYARAPRWLSGEPAQRPLRADPPFLLMWLAAAIAPSVFAPALASLGRALDPDAVLREQREALTSWLRGEPPRPHAGPWSLAAARTRSAAPARR